MPLSNPVTLLEKPWARLTSNRFGSWRHTLWPKARFFLSVSVYFIPFSLDSKIKWHETDHDIVLIRWSSGCHVWPQSDLLSRLCVVGSLGFVRWDVQQSGLHVLYERPLQHRGRADDSVCCGILIRLCRATTATVAFPRVLPPFFGFEFDEACSIHHLQTPALHLHCSALSSHPSSVRSPQRAETWKPGVCVASFYAFDLGVAGPIAATAPGVGCRHQP